jgi:ComF family protein
MAMSKNIADIFGRMAATLFPERCAFCGELTGGGLLCGRCEKACAPLGHAGLFLSADFSRFAALCAGTAYEGRARAALLRLKKTPDTRLAEAFARLMLAALRAERATGFDMLVPVPASAEKLKERGFNQAELLAVRLGALCGAPVLPNALLRRDSLAQHTLDRLTRLQNAEAAYAVDGAASVKGKNVLLVDDVLTTGATMSACGALLLEAGARGVSAVAATATK